MKLNKLVLACAAALALPAVAHATVPAGSAAVVLPPLANQVYGAGASAPDNFLAAIAASMFQNDATHPLFSYSNTGVIPGSAYTAFMGFPNASTGLPTTQKVLLIKRSKGGSAFGVVPVADAQPIQTLDISAASCTLVSGTLTTTSTYQCNPKGLDPSQGFSPDSIAPDFGVSDVAPFMFKGVGINLEFGQLAPSGNPLTIIPVQTVMMGIVATRSVPDDAFLSRAVYGSMLSGIATDWSMVQRNGVAGGTVAPAAGTQVVVCRRWPGSGTQATYNSYFNNFPCTNNSLTSGVNGDIPSARLYDSVGYGVGNVGLGTGNTPADAIGVSPALGYTVIENAGSGDVRACLRAAEFGGDYTFLDEKNKYHVAHFGTGGYGAIGVLSLDSQLKNSTTALDGGAELYWWFRPLDGAGQFHAAGLGSCTTSSALPTKGVCPTLQNLLQGNYDLAGESTMQYRPTLPVGSIKKGFTDEFAKRAGDPIYQQNWTATLALPSNGFTPLFDINGNVTPASHVARATRFGNMCAPLQHVF